MMDNIQEYCKKDDSTNRSVPSNDDEVSNSSEKFFERFRDALSVRAKNILKDNGLYHYGDFMRFISSSNNQFVKLRNCGKKTVKELDELASLLMLYVNDPSSLLTIPIEELGFSIRALNALKGSHIETLGELVSFTKVDISKFHGFGKKTLQEIEDAVVNKGLWLGLDIQTNGTRLQFISDDDAIKNTNVIKEEEQDEIIDTSILNIPIEDLGLSVRAFNCLEIAEVKTLGELVVLKSEDLLKFRNFGRLSLIETEKIVESKGLRLGMHLNNYHKEKAINQQELEPLIPESSAFRSLSKADMDYSLAFKEKYSHFPMVFLLHKTLDCLTEQEQKIVKMVWGLNSFSLLPDGNELPGFKDWSVKPALPKSTNEISNEFGLSRQRIHQIYQKAIRRIKYLGNGVIHVLEFKDWERYGIGKDIPFLFASNLKSDRLVEERDFLIEYIKEHWTSKWIYQFVKDIPYVSENTLYFVSFLKGLTPLWIDHKKKQLSNNYLNIGRTVPDFFVNNRLKQYNYYRAVKEIFRLQKAKKQERVSVPIKSYFIDNKTYWSRNTKLTAIDKDDVLQLLIWTFQTLCGVQIENGNVLFNANQVNYYDEIYEILKIAGVRLHRDELLKRLKTECDKKGFRCDYTSSSQITPFLTRDPRVVTYGRSSYWGLKEWGDSYGSIRELALRVVSESESPIHIDNLAKLILKSRPDSNEKSISSIIRQTVSSGELLLFYGDYIGNPEAQYSNQYIIMPQTFDEWLYAFKKYVINNKRYPLVTSQGFEGYLYRWHNKAKQLIDLSADEILKIDALEKELELYPHNITEYNFLHNCNIYKKFVEGNNRMLNINDDSKLYQWFYVASRDYSMYNDNRNKYFSQLLQYLSSIMY